MIIVPMFAECVTTLKPQVETAAERLEREEERAAIMEYDGGLPRDEAERKAREQGPKQLDLLKGRNTNERSQA